MKTATKPKFYEGTTEAQKLEEIRERLHMVTAMCKDRLKKIPMPPNLKYLGMDDFVLQHGIACKAAELPTHIRRGTPKQCFNNAGLLTMSDHTLTYVEGYVWCVIPIHHAWCIDKDGVVIDPTIDCPDKLAYFGVPFNSDFIADAFTARDHFGVLDDWQMGFPLLKGEYDNKDIFATGFK